jgi:DNA-binding transcriptional ArsR family regulator
MQHLNLFYRTKFSRAEEDRATNALLLTLQEGGPEVLSSFLGLLGIPNKMSTGVTRLGEQISYSAASRIDAEIEFGNELLIAIESKVVRGQLENTDQVENHLKHLEKQKRRHQYLLTLTPDICRPSPLAALEVVYRTRILWMNWDSLSRWSVTKSETLPDTAVVSRYLLGQLAEYLRMVGLCFNPMDNNDSERFRSQLRVIVGSESSEKTLLLLYHHGALHVRAISQKSGLALRSIQQALTKLRDAGIVTARASGNRLNYSLNDDAPLMTSLKTLLGTVYQSFSEEDRIKLLGVIES